ncbi:hypothetical protein BD410DRAFT_786509 [Rickenella mellea]|uniref:Uncharacterized protein n=1 Tax=Rickenella mellea TaxID=50990 RepID=A0A4Y7QAU7_9AGAM|nr:hypothetical protein BD410DRAFT_786509 [Rickenella mellea]
MWTWDSLIALRLLSLGWNYNGGFQVKVERTMARSSRGLRLRRPFSLTTARSTLPPLSTSTPTSTSITLINVAESQAYTFVLKTGGWRVNVG